MHNSRSISPIHSQFNLANKLFFVTVSRRPVSFTLHRVHPFTAQLFLPATINHREASIHSTANIASAPRLPRFVRSRFVSSHSSGYLEAGKRCCWSPGSSRVSFSSITLSSPDWPPTISQTRHPLRRRVVYIFVESIADKSQWEFFCSQILDKLREKIVSARTVEHLAGDYFGTLWYLSLTTTKKCSVASFLKIAGYSGNYPKGRSA